MWNSIRFRLTLTFIGLAIGPLLLVGAILAQRSFVVEREQALALQSQVAQRVAAEVDTYFQEVETDLRALGNEIRGLEQPDRAQQMSLLLGALSSGPYRDAYQELTLLDETGREQFRLSRLEIVASDELQDRAGAAEYERPKATRETYFGPVWFDDTTGESFITIAIPLSKLRSVELSGVLVADLRVATVENIIARMQLGEGQTAYLADSQGRVIAHQDRSTKFLGAHIDLPGQAGTQRGLSGTEAVLAVDKIQLGDQTFSVVAEKPASEALALASNTVTTIAIVIAVAFMAAAGVGFLAVRQIVRPIEALAATAQRITAGDLYQKATVTRRDEIGTLAFSFNSMTEQLRETLAGLEQRVAARTRDLALSAEISRRLSSILDQHELIAEVVEQIRSTFNYYHVHIYLYDDRRESLVMAGGTGEAARTMLARGDRLQEGRGLVGRAAGTNSPVLVPDVSNDPGWLPNPLLPDTKSEMAVPIAVGGRVLGILDVQHNVVNALKQDDIQIIESIANQVAIALQNTRSFRQTQQQAERETKINTITEKIQRAATVERVLEIAARELGQALGAQRATIQLETVKTRRGQAVGPEETE